MDFFSSKFFKINNKLNFEESSNSRSGTRIFRPAWNWCESEWLRLREATWEATCAKLVGGELSSKSSKPHYELLQVKSFGLNWLERQTWKLRVVWEFEAKSEWIAARIVCTAHCIAEV